MICKGLHSLTFPPASPERSRDAEFTRNGLSINACILVKNSLHFLISIQ